MKHTTRPSHILVVNQYGENREDEAAMRAMLNSFERNLGNVKFSIILQFKDRNLKKEFGQDVQLLHMIMPIRDAIALSLYAIGKVFKCRCSFLPNRRTRKIVEAYENADLVVSAPGGPYFGDIYYKHELVHWFYIWLAFLHNKPLFLYATSCGPISTTSRNGGTDFSDEEALNGNHAGILFELFYIFNNYLMRRWGFTT